MIFFFSSRRRHTRWPRDWSSDVCSSDLEGLAARFDPVAAAKALEYAHAEVFREVSLMPLGQLSDDLERYMQSAKEEPLAFLTAWQELEPYRVAIPMYADPTVAELFVSNIKIALAVLRYRLPKEPGHQS